MSLADDILKKSVAGSDKPAASAHEGTSESASLLSLNSLSDKVPKAKTEDDKPAVTPVSMPANDAPSTNLLASANKGNAAASLSTLVGNFEQKAAPKADHSGGFAVGTVVGFGSNIVGQVTGVKDIFIKKQDDSATLMSTATGVKTGNESALNNAVNAAGALAGAGGDLVLDGVDQVAGTKMSKGQTSSAIGKAFDKVKNDWSTGDAYTRGEIVGNVLGFGATAFVGGGAAVKGSRAVTGNAAELRVIASGYKEANLALESINGLRATGGLMDDAAKLANVARTTETAASTSWLRGLGTKISQTFPMSNPLKPAYAGADASGLGMGTTKRVLSQGESSIAGHTPVVNDVLKTGPLSTRVDFTGANRIATTVETGGNRIATTVETGAGKNLVEHGTGTLEGRVTGLADQGGSIKVPGTHTIDEGLKGHVPHTTKEVIDPAGVGTHTPKEVVPRRVETGQHTPKVETGHIADDVKGKQPVVQTGEGLVDQTPRTHTVAGDETVKAPSEHVAKPGNATITGAGDNVVAGQTDNVVAGTKETVVKPGSGQNVVSKPAVAVDEVAHPGTQVKAAEVVHPEGAVNFTKPGVVDDGIKAGTNTKPVEVPAGAQKVDVVHPKLEVVEPKLQVPGAAIKVESVPLASIETATQQVVASGTKLGDNAAQLASTASSTVISSNLDEIVRLSRTLGHGADDVAVSQIKTHIDDIARAGGDDISKQLRRGLDDIERRGAVTKSAQAVHTATETLGTKAASFSDETAQLATKTRAGSPLIGEKLDDVSKLSRQLGQTGIADQAAVIKQMRTALDDIARNGGDDVAKKLGRSLDDIERTSTSVANLRLTQEVVESSSKFGDNVAQLAGTTSNTAITTNLDEIARISRTFGQGADNVAVSQIKNLIDDIARSGGDDIAKQLRRGLEDVERTVAKTTQTLKPAEVLGALAPGVSAATASFSDEAAQLANNTRTSSPVVSGKLDDVTKLSRQLGEAGVVDQTAIIRQMRTSLDDIAGNGGEDVARKLGRSLDDIERSTIAAKTQSLTQQVVESGAKLGDDATKLAGTTSSQAIGSNLDEIARLSRTLGQGADDLAVKQIKNHIDDIARSGGDDIAKQLRRGLDDVERSSAISKTAQTLNTTTETLGKQTVSFSDDAAKLATKTKTSSPVVSEKLEDVSRLSRDLGNASVVDQAAIVKQMRTALDDIAGNGGDDVARKLGRSLDDIERTTSSVKNLHLTQQVQETALTVNRQIATVTDDLATKVTGKAAPAIKEELNVISKATDDLVKGTDAAAAARVQESLAKLERMTVGTNVADDVTKLANHTAKLESTVAVSRTATALETNTQTVVKQASQLADNAVAPALKTQAERLAGTTGSKVVTEQLDEISRLARTVGKTADDAAVLQQIKQSVNTIVHNGGDDIAKQLKGGIDDLERSVGSASTLKVTTKIEESALSLRTQVANLSDNIVEKVPGATGPAVREELKVLSKATDDLVKGVDQTAAARVRESLTKIEGATRNTAAADDVAKLANETAKLEGTVSLANTTRALETTTQTLGTQGTKLSDDIAKMAQTAKASGTSTPVVVAEKLDDMSKLAAKIGTTGDDLAIVAQLRRGVDDIARNGGDDIARQLRNSVDEIERTAGTANKLKLTQRVEESALNLRTQVSNLSDNVAKTPGIDAAASQAFKQELKNLTTATDDMLRGVDNAAATRVNQSLKNIEQMTSGTRFADDFAKVSDDAAKLQSSVNITRTARTLETTTETMVGQATRLGDDATRFATTSGNTVSKAVTEKLDEVSQLSRTIGKSGDDLTTLRTIRTHLDDVSRQGGDDIARQLRTSVDELERTAKQAQALKLTQKIEESALSVRTQVGALSDDLLKTPTVGSQALRQELRNFANATDDLVRGADDAAALRVRNSIDKIEQLTATNPTLKVGNNVTKLSDDVIEMQNAVNASRTFQQLENVTQAITRQSTTLGDDAARLAQTAGNKVVSTKLDEISQLSRTIGKAGDDVAIVKQIKTGLDDIVKAGGDDVAKQLRNGVDDLERSTLNANRLTQTQKVQEFASTLRTQVANVTDNAVSSTTASALKQELKTVSRATDDLVRGADDVAAMKTINTSANNLQQMSVGTRFSDDVARLVDDTRALQKTVTASRTTTELTVASEKLVASGTRLSDDATRLATTGSGKVVADKLDEISNAARTLGKTTDDVKAVTTIKNSLDDITKAGGDDVARQLRPALAEIESTALQTNRLREAQRLALTVEDDAARIAKTAKELSESVVGTSNEARLLRQHLNTISRTADELPTAANPGAQVSKIKTAIESVKSNKGAQFVDDLERSVATLDASVVKSSTAKVYAEQGRRIESLVTTLQDDVARASQNLKPLVMPERQLIGDLSAIEVQTGKLVQTLKPGAASNVDNAAAQAEHIAAIRRTIAEIGENGHTTIAQNLNKTINGIDEAIKIQKFEQLSAHSETLAGALKQQVADIKAVSTSQAVQKLQQSVAELPATSSPQLVLSTLKDGVKGLEGTAGGAAIAQQLSPTITKLEATLTQQRGLATELIDSTATTIESQIRGIQTAGRLSTQQGTIAAATENVQFVRHLTAQTDSKMALQAEQTQQHLTRLEMASKAAANSEVARAGESKVLAMAEQGHEAATNKILLQGFQSEGSKFRTMASNSNSLFYRVDNLIRSNSFLVGLVKDSQLRRSVFADSQGASAGLRMAGAGAATLGFGTYVGYNLYYHTSILPRKILQEQAEQEQQRQKLQLENQGVERADAPAKPAERVESAAVAPINPVERRAEMEFTPSVAEALRASQRRTVIPTDGIAARHGISPNDPDGKRKEASLIQTGRIYSWSNKGFAPPNVESERVGQVQTAKSLRMRPTAGGTAGDNGIRLPKTAVAEYEFNYTKATRGLNTQNKLLASATDGRKSIGLGGRYGSTSTSTPMSQNLRTMVAHNAFRSEGMAHGNQILNGAEATENTGLDQAKSGGAANSTGPQLTMNQDGTFSVVTPDPSQDPSSGQSVLNAQASNTNLVDQLAQKYAVGQETEATA